jgi:SAM-dependent methyltransferase
MSACVVCGNTELKPSELNEAQEAARQNVPDELPYETCTRCGLWLQLPPPPFQYEADDKEGAGMKEVALSEAGHFRWLSNLLVNTYGPNSVLDIGPSYPIMLKCMQDKGVSTVLGIDGSPYILEYGEELEVPVICGDFMEHDFGPRRFDLISMVHVIEHFHEPLYAIMKMKSLLNPNGVIFLRTPLNDTEGLTRWHLTEYHFQVHPIIFSQRSLKMMCELAGLQMVYEAVGNGVGHGDYVFKLR